MADVLARVSYKFLREMMLLVEKSASKEILDQKDKSDNKGRGCLESVKCVGAGQVVIEILR